MVDARRPANVRAYPGGTAAAALAGTALACALIATPGGLVWISIYWPEVGVPNEGVLSVLANLVTIPAAVLSWLLAVGGVLAAIIGLSEHRQDRRARLALIASTPGAVLGTVLIALLAAQFGSAIGVLPNEKDLQRQAAARAVATHLALPDAGPRLIARCEGKAGTFQQMRSITVVEQWSQARVDQIRGRLLDYTETASYPPQSPSDRQKINFWGKDAQGNVVQVFVDRYPAGTALPLECRKITSHGEALQTTIFLGNF